MIQIVAVNGYPESGKTTFEDLCIRELGHAWGTKTSTVEFIKTIATLMGWNGEKTPEARAFLSDLKDLASRSPWGDIPFLEVKNFCVKKDYELMRFDMEKSSTIYVFVDVREPENIQKFKEELGAITLFVKRNNPNGKIFTNHADANVEQFQYDFIIDNTGTLQDLKKIAKEFIIELKKNKGLEMYKL